ncbi:CRISPR-associated protein Cas4 [Vulcanibacillus modesticaldus]|uniref:CRISPR-associated exonuclease Cas4 n=1 Tax=Vulcanibacillus modesticaldus TaxID=337097 RepID=A0A1D2YWU8_9BACI|nr:CRISPR-associated protein Cas4 [Vulcanibacillus modesticaldus]OEG00199.1 CRISPR-associated protein Cas4 [Vulcanibacillus modesticaldus]
MIQVTDIKQYVYCPRVIYYTYVMPVNKKVTYKMEHGREQHRLEMIKEKRRGLKSYSLIEGKRYFDYQLKSEKLGLTGKLDLLIETDNSSQPAYPVEMKYTFKGIQANIKYQLGAYALLLEEKYNTSIDEGFIYIIPKKEIHTIPISQEMKEYAQKVISAIHNIIEKEHFPDPKSKRRCHDCEFRKFCNDLY